MKKKYIFILLVFSLVFVSCENYKIKRNELDETMFISVVGVDVSTDNKVTVTIAPKISNISEKNSSVQNKSYVISSEGDTIFEAVRKISTNSDTRPFLGNVEYVIIGEEAAKKDIIKYLDYFSRDHEFRLNTKIFISKGCNAKEILEHASTSNMVLSDYLKSLLSNVDNNSTSSKTELFELMHKFNNESSSPYIPCIIMKNKNSVNINQFSIQLNGYGIFKDAKLVGYLMDKEARGLNWGLNKIKSGVLIVKDINGDNITLEIVESTSKIIPQYSKENLSVLIKVRSSSNISEITGREDVFTKDYFSYLEKQQANIIKSELESALAFARKNNTDIFNINEAIFRKYPVMWNSLKGDWNNIFPEMDIKLEVNSIINRTYEIKKPTDSKNKEGALK